MFVYRTISIDPKFMMLSIGIVVYIESMKAPNQGMLRCFIL